MAGLVWRIQDLVIEDREVQGETETNRMRGRKIGLSDVGCSLVSLKRLVGGGLALVAEGELGEIAVVVALPIRVSILKHANR